MAIPTKWVKKNMATGEISFVAMPFFLFLTDRYRYKSKGFADYVDYRYAATAEIAVEQGWLDMAEAWRDEHDCPVECTMKDCSNAECQKYKKQS